VLQTVPSGRISYRVTSVGDREIGRVLITKSAQASGGARGLVGS
jgi:hypothetical protein